MVTALNDPKLTVVDLLETEWNAPNTHSITPLFSTGWYNFDYSDPQVTVTSPDEDPILGGNTGFGAIDPSGAGGIKIMMGELMIGCWSHHEDSSGVAPKKLTYSFSEEVKRIITENIFTAGDLDWVSWLGRTERVDTNAPETLFRYDCTVRYKYVIRP